MFIEMRQSPYCAAIKITMAANFHFQSVCANKQLKRHPTPNSNIYFKLFKCIDSVYFIWDSQTHWFIIIFLKVILWINNLYLPLSNKRNVNCNWLILKRFSIVKTLNFTMQLEMKIKRWWKKQRTFDEFKILGPKKKQCSEIIR